MALQGFILVSGWSSYLPFRYTNAFQGRLNVPLAYRVVRLVFDSRAEPSAESLASHHCHRKQERYLSSSVLTYIHIYSSVTSVVKTSISNENLVQSLRDTHWVWPLTRSWGSKLTIQDAKRCIIMMQWMNTGKLYLYTQASKEKAYKNFAANIKQWNFEHSKSDPPI